MNELGRIGGDGELSNKGKQVKTSTSAALAAETVME
jgi:hypothetical protein